MKKFIKKLRRALRAFRDGWKDTGPHKQFNNIGELEEEIKKLETMIPMNPHEILEERLKASALARDAHERQNNQINNFLSQTFRKRIPEYLLQLYGDTKTQVPDLRTHVNYFMALDDITFGRHVSVFYRDEKIGDATFTALFKDGKVDLQVKKNM